MRSLGRSTESRSTSCAARPVSWTRSRTRAPRWATLAISYARSASVATDENKETVMNADGGGRIDGNALAGPLSDVFVADVTSAGVTCTSCGRVQVLAALEVYGTGP